MVNMKVEKFDKEKHFSEVSGWLVGHKIAPPSIDMLSSHGVIVGDIACGFLYITDSSLGFLEFFISNPKSSGIQRHRAIAAITNNLILWAKELGVSLLMANSSNRLVKRLAAENEFKSQGEYEFFVKEL